MAKSAINEYSYQFHTIGHRDLVLNMMHYGTEIHKYEKYEIAKLIGRVVNEISVQK